ADRKVPARVPHHAPAGTDDHLLGLALPLALLAPSGAPRGEGLSGAAAGGTPRDWELKAVLGLAGDPDAALPCGFAEAADATRLGACLELGRRAFRHCGLGERPHHENLLVVDRHRRCSCEPAVREPSGEPTCDRVAACHDYNITSLVGGPNAGWRKAAVGPIAGETAPSSSLERASCQQSAHWWSVVTSPGPRLMGGWGAAAATTTYSSDAFRAGGRLARAASMAGASRSIFCRSCLSWRCLNSGMTSFANSSRDSHMCSCR